MDMDQITEHSEPTDVSPDARAALAALPTIEETDEPAGGASQGAGEIPGGDVTVAMAADVPGLSSPTGFDADDTFTSLEGIGDATVVSDAQPATYAQHFASENAGDASGAQGYTAYQTDLASEAQKAGRGAGVAKRVLVVLGAMALAAAIVYGVAGLYFSTHFMPNTKVNGNEVSSMSVADLAAHVSGIGAGYATHIVGDGIDSTIAAADIDFAIDGEAYASEAHGQLDPWQWPTEVMESHELSATQSISYDQAKLDAALDGIVAKANEGATQPTNATMRYDEATKAFVVQDQAYGTAVDRDAVVATVSEGVSTLQEEIPLGEEQLVQPAIWNDDQKLVDGVATANALLANPIGLRIGGADVTSLDPARVAGWITMSPENDLVANREEIKKWTQGELSQQFDTVGTKRAYTRPDGKQVEVEGGTYGWVLDGETLANVIADNLQAGKTDPIDVPMKATAANWAPGGKEWPDRYIDVDLSEQYVRFYDGTNIIWESECVSGNTSEGHGTSAGVDFVYSKESPTVLIGLDYNHDGQPDYKTPVDFWMPFDGGQGLHDATWRGSFGGNIYTYNGSHGCVNLPWGKAQELYGIVNVGDVVIVHW